MSALEKEAGTSSSGIFTYTSLLGGGAGAPGRDRAVAVGAGGGDGRRERAQYET